jgi:hypothetical protein
MKLTVVLSGPRAGFTGTLSRHKFLNGECIIEGPPQAVESASRYLARSHEAFPAGSEELRARMKGSIHGIQRDTSKDRQPGNPDGVSGSELRPTGPVRAEGDVQRGGHDPVSAAAGGAGLGAGGSGHADTGLHPDKVKALRKAIRALDPKVDEHWTEDGLPSIETISTATSDQNVTRRMIEVVEPKFTREAAREAAEL